MGGGEQQTLALAKLTDHPIFAPFQGLREPRHRVVSNKALGWGVCLRAARLARGSHTHRKGDPESMGGAWGISKEKLPNWSPGRRNV